LIFGRRNSDLSDAQLVLKYQKTLNAKYIGFLFDRYGQLVFGVCLKYLKNEEDSKDALIKIFEKVMDDLKRMEVKHFKSWLYMVAKNHCLMDLRKKKTYTTDINEIQIADEEIEPNKFEMQELKFNDLDQAILELKPDQKKCIMLFYIEEMSYQQIADQTEYTVKDVKSHIQNGKRNLKISLEKKHQTNK
jgi:RNA polymerase sigma-70 factor (ECF subfamily)